MEPKTITRNMIFHILDGVFFLTALIFMDQFTIMIAFVKQIFDNSFILSMVPAAIVIGFNFPGLFTTWIARKFTKRKPFVIIFSFCQRLMVLMLALSCYWILPLPKEGAASLVLLFYFLFGSFGGFSIPAWVDFFAKTVPARKRARVIAIRVSVASLIGVLVPFWLGPFLANNSFPGNYKVAFYIAFIASIISFLSLLGLKEEGLSPVSALNFGGYFKELLGILKNPNFRKFIFARLFFSFTAIGTALYTAYALNLYPSIDEKEVANFVLLLNLSKAVFGFGLGHLGDHFNNLLVQRIGTGAAALSLLLVLFFPVIPVFYLLFILIGISISADLNGFVVMTSEFGNDDTRIYYSALSSGIIGTASGVLPLVMGFLISVRVIEYRGAFLVAFIGTCISLIFYFRMKKNYTSH